MNQICKRGLCETLIKALLNPVALLQTQLHFINVKRAEEEQKMHILSLSRGLAWQITHVHAQVCRTPLTFLIRSRFEVQRSFAKIAAGPLALGVELPECSGKQICNDKPLIRV